MNTKALRQKVLDLAIHGKLVPQNPNDESATVLLEKFRAEKAEKIKKGELKADKKDSFIFVGSDKRHYEQFADGTVKDIEDEIPFEVPDGWAVARMGTYITFTGGAQPPKETFEYSPNENNIRLIQIRDYKTDDFATYIPKNLARRFCSKTDVMIGRYGPPLFQILRGIEGAYNVAIMKAEAVPEIMQNDYLYYMLQDGTLLHFLESLSDRTCGQDGVNMFELNNYLILIPPYEEQTRIIKKLEETFPIIESLADNIDDLKVAIKHAKSKILDLAIHGKLVPQDSNDEPAEELLKRIATSDNRPYKKFEEEEPFEIPSNWSWCFLGDICSKIKRGKSPKYVDKSTIMAFAQKCNQKDGPTSLDKALYIDETTLKKYPEEEKMQFNDIVINSTGTGTLGRVGIFNCSIPNDVNAVYPDSHVTTVRILPEIDKLYCYYFIKNKQSYLETMGEGSTNQKELKPDTISSLYFPLPSYPEQKRIVSKIEELFSSLETIVSNLD